MYSGPGAIAALSKPGQLARVPTLMLCTSPSHAPQARFHMRVSPNTRPCAPQCACKMPTAGMAPSVHSTTNKSSHVPTLIHQHHPWPSTHGQHMHGAVEWLPLPHYHIMGYASCLLPDEQGRAQGLGHATLLDYAHPLRSRFTLPFLPPAACPVWAWGAHSCVVIVACPP